MKRLLYWVPVLLWMGLIFYSGQTGEASGGLSGNIVTMVHKGIAWTGIAEESLHTLIRKTAHFMAYFVLGVLTLFALLGKEAVSRKHAILAMVIAALYAASDEFHQSFVPGRGPAVTDVLIDSSGAAAGIAVYLWISRKFKKPA